MKDRIDKSDYRSMNEKQQSLFPLPMTIFEEYMLVDDSVAYPMDTLCLIRFQNVPDPLLFQQAFESATARHPLFSCRVERGRRGNFYWIPSDKPLDFRRLDAYRPDVYNASGFPNVEPIHIFKEAGFRVYFIERGQDADVLLQLHHSVCDGVGETEFIYDVLLELALKTNAINDIGMRRELDPNVLLQRGRLGWSIASYLKNIFYTDGTARRFLWRRIEPVVRSKTSYNEIPVKEYPFIRTLNLSDQETSACIERSKRENCTVNDLLMTAFFIAIDRWQKVHNCTSKHAIRMAIPMNLRNANHYKMPSGNVVSMVMVDVTPRERVRPDQLLQIVARRMQSIKKHDQKYTLNLFLKIGKFLARFIGSNLSLFLRSNQCRATACLSNLGKILEKASFERTPEGKIRIGEIVVDSIIAAPPIRSGTALSLLALTYSGSLSFCLRYDSQLFTIASADELLCYFHDALL